MQKMMAVKRTASAIILIIIYGKGVFAGFYDGEFFWGKYCDGAWKAEYLFGLEHSRGKYVLFPPPAITTDNAASP